MEPESWMKAAPISLYVVTGIMAVVGLVGLFGRFSEEAQFKFLIAVIALNLINIASQAVILSFPLIWLKRQRDSRRLWGGK